MIDTHSHIYSEEFDNDLFEVVERAKAAGVKHIVLPNVDVETLERLHQTEKKYNNYCHAAIGLHPTSVDANYKESLSIIKNQLKQHSYIGIGEIGLDLYWDKTFLQEQIIAFEQQIEWSIEYKLPIIIHQRDAYQEVMASLKKYQQHNIFGVFHSFGGTAEQATEILSLGNFKIGINGIVTFKNSTLNKTLENIQPSDLVLETDAPYLSPVPYRGKRNEPSYLPLICKKIAAIYNISPQRIDEITSRNASILFNL